MNRFERAMVWSSTIAVTATGLVYAGMKHLLTAPDEFAIVNHPLQPLVLKLHIVSAPLLVFAIGMIATRHIWPHFKAGVKYARRSGLSTAVLIVPMILSGYLIQALTAAPVLDLLGWVHLALGSIFALGAAAHAIATRRTRACGRADASVDITRSPRGRQSLPGSADGTAGRSPARVSSRTGT